MITFNNTCIRQGKQILLNPFNWTIYQGERIGIIGANGSGKTTLLSVLLGKHEIDAGELCIPNHVVFSHVEQEMPHLDKVAIEYVLDGDTTLRTIENKLKIAEERNDGTRMAALHDELTVIDAYTAPTRAAKILTGLGFTQDEHLQSVATFSGGWRVRLNLAKALMCRSDVLLLDEPTNHLDLDAILWLEGWLSTYQGTLLVISHDREFLDKVVDHIAHLSQQTLTCYSGNYSTFETLRASKLLLQQAQYEKQQQQIAHMKHFIDRFRYKASKAKQAQSRLKAIERMELVCAVQADSQFEFHFLPPKRTSNPLLALHKASVGYNRHTVLSDLNLTISPKDRIGILGPNGAGKSTFIKLLASKLAARTGDFVKGAHLNIGYFAQHQVDELKLDESPLEHLKTLSPKASEQELRKFLGTFGFSRDQALEPVRYFSGGEKSRLALALIVWQQPNLLLLDEPTNHLDLDMRNALSIALQEYEGAMLLVSHDRFLIKTTTDKLLLVAHGKLDEFDGDLDEYQTWLIEFRKNRTQPSLKPIEKPIKSDSGQPNRHLKTSSHIKKIEEKLKKLQAKAKTLEDSLTDQTLYEPQNSNRLQEQLTDFQTVKAAIEETELAWLEESEKK